MPDSATDAPVSAPDVRLALEEYDRLGAESFLKRHGFGRARSYVLLHEGKAYDAKAVLAVAQRLAAGEEAPTGRVPKAPVGGESIAATELRELGFEVTSTSTAQAVSAEAGEGVEPEQARETWSEAAREVLSATARRYRAVITYAELADRVQDESGVRTRQLIHHWIGDVLTRVTADCAKREEPLLSALCVNAQGSVGPGYAAAVQAATGTAPADPDTHAADQRLACHQHWEATNLPGDGGSAVLTEQLARARGRERKAALAERVIPTCPHCHMALPATGVCDNCG